MLIFFTLMTEFRLILQDSNRKPTLKQVSVCEAPPSAVNMGAGSAAARGAAAIGGLMLGNPGQSCAQGRAKSPLLEMNLRGTLRSVLPC